MKLKHKIVFLHGPLKELCNDDSVVKVSGTSVRAVVSSLSSRYGDKVKKYFRENKWQIFLGKDEHSDVGENQLDDKFEDGVIHFYPVIEGAGGRIGRIILGAALITAGVFISGASFGAASVIGGALISTGVGLILAGLFQPSLPESRERPDERPSFLFNGATNTSVEGSAVPLIFGRTRTGSVTVSAGIDVEKRQFTSPSDPSPGGPGGAGGFDPRRAVRLF